MIRARAPEVDLPAPRLEVIDDAANGGVRTLRLSSPRGAPYAHLEMDLPGEWTEASVDGEEIYVSKVPAEQRGTFAMTQLESPR